MSQNMKKKKDKLDVPAAKEISGYTYRLVFAPSLTSDAINSDTFNFYDLPFVRPGVHVNSSNSPIKISWVGNKAVLIQFFNQDLYMYSVYGDYVKIEKDRGDKNKWSYLKQEIDGTRIISKT